MPKKPVSLTLDEVNLLWLRARGYGRGNLSRAVDELISEARAGRLGGPPEARSVVGTIDLPPDDSQLEHADAAVRDIFARSLARPMRVKERPASAPPSTRRRRSGRG